MLIPIKSTKHHLHSILSHVIMYIYKIIPWIQTLSEKVLITLQLIKLITYTPVPLPKEILGSIGIYFGYLSLSLYI